jgi:hypothetical protein
VQIFSDSCIVYPAVVCEPLVYILEFSTLCVCVLATCVCFQYPVFGCFLTEPFMLQISGQHIHGCQILDFLHREVTCSVNDVKEPLKWLVFNVCVGDMYTIQICNYL